MIGVLGYPTLIGKVVIGYVISYHYTYYYYYRCYYYCYCLPVQHYKDGCSNWVSPRWAIDDTIAEVSDTPSSHYGLFNALFGTAKVLINDISIPWEYPCCIAPLSSSTVVGDANYQSTTADDFSIINCMHRYLDGVSI